MSSPPPYSYSIYHIVGEVGGEGEFSVEDSGACKYVQISDPKREVFVRVHSYLEDDQTEHTEFDDLMKPNSRYRVTIERWDGG